MSPLCPARTFRKWRPLSTRAARTHATACCARARVCADGFAARGARAQDARNARRARAACAADFAAVIWSSFSSSCNPGCPLSCMSLLSENRHALALRRVDALPGGTASNTPCASTCGLVAMMSAQHAEGHRFNPDQVYASTNAMRAWWVAPRCLGFELSSGRRSQT